MKPPLPLNLGDVLLLRKKHPCGNDTWVVIRLGADIRIRCLKCGHSVLIPRSKLERMIRKILERANENRDSRPD
ncbi:MAG: DUF951 domain-containing protein [Caldiserica bacterium]|jgi:hypothetical protein|nr:DUF951 domain-containing protein [Caldisericota bacterium]MDH7562792.1 DUF951 domain-containing protein [Caldisericota bacterium]